MSSEPGTGDDSGDETGIDNEPFESDNYFRSTYSAIGEYLEILVNVSRFIEGLENVTDSFEEPDDVHRFLFEWTVVHPWQLQSYGDRAQQSVFELKSDCEWADVDEKILSEKEMFRKDDVEIEEQDEEYYIEDYLRISPNAEQIASEDLTAEDNVAKSILIHWPEYYEDSLSDEFQISTTALSEAYQEEVTEFPLSTLFSIIEENGLEFLSIVETMIDQFQIGYRTKIAELLDLEDEFVPDGGYTLNPSIIGSIGLSVLGLFSIAGGLVAGDLAVILTGCVAVLSGIQSWPYEYNIEIDRI